MTDRLESAAIHVRPAVSADLEDVRQVLVETWHDTYDPLLGRDRVTEITGRWHSVPALAAQLGAGDTAFLVAEAEGRIVGHAFVDFRRPPVARLMRLYVLPAWQRRGIGARLLAVGPEMRAGIECVALDVEADNAKAVNFYRGQGFVVVGRSSTEGLECLQMELARRPPEP